jgi:putative phosphoribosyl transferase
MPNEKNESYGANARGLSMEPVMPFADRRTAGRELATRLSAYRGHPDVVVLGLPRGGVPVAFEIAEALDAPLDVFVVRKLGMPGQPEFAIGAIASGGVRVLSDDVISMYGVPRSTIEAITSQERGELHRREREYRDGRALGDLRHKTVILADDGLATGSTMRAAVDAVRALGPKRIIVAVPVGAPDTCREFANIADEIVCARMPESFSAVGRWYRDFSQTTDQEVQMLLRERAAAR